MVSATNLVEAQAIEAAGIDIIIAQGIEAGGHRGIFNKTFDAAIKTSDLVHLIVKHCKPPVVAAGGIMNGAQARHMLSLGAAAVQLGTHLCNAIHQMHLPSIVRLYLMSL